MKLGEPSRAPRNKLVSITGAAAAALDAAGEVPGVSVGTRDTGENMPSPEAAGLGYLASKSGVIGSAAPARPISRRCAGQPSPAPPEAGAVHDEPALPHVAGSHLAERGGGAGRQGGGGGRSFAFLPPAPRRLLRASSLPPRCVAARLSARLAAPS